MTLFSPQIVGPLWGVSELVLTILMRSKSDAISKDRHSIKMIWLVILSAVALGVAADYRLSACRFPRSELVIAIACCLYIFGIALRWYSIVYLGRFFTINVAIAKDHYVVDSGPYYLVRHPSYTGLLLVVLGFALSFHNWASLLLVFLPCCAVMLFRVQIEEAALLEALGERYRSYMVRTKRLIPLIY